MLDDAQPVVVLTRGQSGFRDLPTLDLLDLPEDFPPCEAPAWLDDPSQRLATLFYTSGTTGKPKGVECPHAGYVNLALTYADYFDLVPGMDATTLTSSLGYDGSISEMYSAWVSGCAVVMLTREQIRSGPELLPVLREAEVTVLFCPPVLLTTLTPSPEMDLPYPLCRFIVPAGEAFPGALVEPWTRGSRQIINTYGPTEASTDTSRQSLRPGEPVTIGTPLANVNYVILEVDGTDPLPHGEAGELCIGGVHLARGYRNLPGQTARKFIEHPRFGRLYRTGDRCKIDVRTQRVHFMGRVDAQLKVRGHRVEVQAVEDILQDQFGEIEAAVLDYQNHELVAFVAAPSLAGNETREAVPAPAEWAARVTSALARQLPAPSVPHRIFLVREFALKPRSGKIDRERLPQLTRPTANGVQETPGSSVGAVERGQDPDDAIGTVAENAGDFVAGGEDVLAICGDVFETPPGWDDTFADHGGHSIVIAQLAQRLHAAGWGVSVRDLLSDCNTPRKVANHPREFRGAADVSPAPPTGGPGNGERDEAAARILSAGFFTLLQALFLLLLYAPPLAGFVVAIALAEIGEFFMTAEVWEFVAIGFVLSLAARIIPFASLLWVLLIKLFMGGHVYRNKVTPGVYPKWSRMHLRTWCIERLERSVLRPLGSLFRSAPLQAYVLRRLGADVGKNLQCAEDANFSGPLDLLSIGDDVAIQTGAYIHTTRWQGQDLHVGPVRLESGCKIGMRAAVANDVTVGGGSWIQPFTAILGNVGSGEMWDGAPARLSGRCTELKRTASVCKRARPSGFVEAFNIFMQLFLDFVLVVAPTAAVTWFAATFLRVEDTGIASEYFRVTPLPEIAWQMGLYAFVTSWATIVLVSVVSCLFLRFTAASPGLYSSHGLKGAMLLYRLKTMNQVQRLWTWTITGQYLRALAGLRFPRAGGSECDVMFNLVPELASADSQVFWSNGCFTNMLDYGARHMVLRRLDMPRNFFSGNNSVAESGQLPTNFLLGVSTSVSDVRFRRQMHSRPGEPITVAGNPPVMFASADFEAENERHRRPGFLLFLARMFLNDVFSMSVLGMASLLVYVILYTTLLQSGVDVLTGALIALMLAEFILVLSSAVIKKVLVGSKWGSDHSAPFWSWRHFSYFFVQDCFFAWCRFPLAVTAGTLLSNPILRSMGCRIGRRTIVTSPMQASDWNAVSFGDDCLVAGFLQFHTFENMTLKVKKCQVRDGSAVNFGATVMGGAEIEPGTTLEPLSLVLKEMRLPAGTYQGSPTEAVSAT